MYVVIADCIYLAIFTDPIQVDAMWESMCQSAITLITSGFNSVTSDEMYLKIKGRLGLFIQSMGVSITKICSQADLANQARRAGDTTQHPWKHSNCKYSRDTHNYLSSVSAMTFKR